MKIIERYDSVVKIFLGKGYWALLTPVRYLLAAFYRVFLSLAGNCRKAADDRGEGRTNGAPITISIGNIEVGGGGKTPAAIAIAGNIRRAGGAPVIVTRGYRSYAESAGRSVVIPGPGRSLEEEGEDYIIERMFLDHVRAKYSCTDRVKALGDEAARLAARGFPVVIAKDRTRGLKVATRLFDPTHLILDDAFHKFRIRKDIDLLLLDHARPFGRGWVLPAGTLREPPSSVRRSDAVIFTRSSGEDVPEEAERFLPGKKVYFSRHLPSGLRDRTGDLKPFSVCTGRKVVSFSGIARPESFESALIDVGLEPEVSIRFQDHHPYSEKDVSGILAEGTDRSVYITTEKDRLKAIRFFDEKHDFYSLEIEMEIFPAGSDGSRDGSPRKDVSVDIDSILVTAGRRGSG